MAMLRIFTHPKCPHCKTAKKWLESSGQEFEELDITSNVAALREWRDLTGGVGVPVLAHGKDFIVGFDPQRYRQMVDCCEHTTEVNPAEE